MSVPAIRTTRIPQRLIYAKSQARGEPVKKASYERSKNAWRTCDLRICRRGPPARNLRHLLFFASRLLSPSAPIFPLSFSPFLFHRASVSSPPGLGPLPPFCGLRIKAAPDLWVGRTLQMDVILAPFRCVWRRTRLPLPHLQKIAVGKKEEGGECSKRCSV